MSTKNQVTIKVIAENAKVSVSTVSRVLSGQAEKYRISKKTEQLVLKIAMKLNYEPNQLARALRTKQTNTIGMIIPDISNPFFSAIARCVEIESRKAGYSVIICDSQEDPEIERDSIKTLSTRKIDGMVICPVGNESKYIIELSRRNIPIVTVDRFFPDLNLPFVVTDNCSGSKQAINHFVENGHKKIAFIQGIIGSSVNDDRVKGYKAALRMNNIPIKDSYIVGDNFGEQNGYISTKILLNEADPPTAIFAGSNLISLGSMRAIFEENLNIPDDISMIAFDDQFYSGYLATPMTTVGQKKEDLGKISITLLLDEINSSNSIDKKGIVLPPELIIRKSVKKLTEENILEISN